MRKYFFASTFIFAFCFAAFGQDSPCPDIKLTGPASILEPNGIANFLVIVSKDSKNPLALYKGEKELKYIWIIKNGKIISGQGTISVNVRVDSTLSPTATVEVKGLPEGCINSASESFLGDPLPEAKIVGEFKTSSGQINYGEFEELVDVLKSEPTTTAYIIISSDNKTSSKRLKRIERQIRKYLSDKDAPTDRIIIVKGGSGKDLIHLFIVPAGATPPTP